MRLLFALLCTTAPTASHASWDTLNAIERVGLDGSHTMLFTDSRGRPILEGRLPSPSGSSLFAAGGSTAAPDAFELHAALASTQGDFTVGTARPRKSCWSIWCPFWRAGAGVDAFDIEVATTGESWTLEFVSEGLASNGRWELYPKHARSDLEQHLVIREAFETRPAFDSESDENDDDGSLSSLSAAASSALPQPPARSVMLACYPTVASERYMTSTALRCSPGRRSSGDGGRFQEESQEEQHGFHLSLGEASRDPDQEEADSASFLSGHHHKYQAGASISRSGSGGGGRRWSLGLRARTKTPERRASPSTSSPSPPPRAVVVVGRGLGSLVAMVLVSRRRSGVAASWGRPWQWPAVRSAYFWVRTRLVRALFFPVASDSIIGGSVESSVPEGAAVKASRVTGPAAGAAGAAEEAREAVAKAVAKAAEAADRARLPSLGEDQLLQRGLQELVRTARVYALRQQNSDGADSRDADRRDDRRGRDRHTGGRAAETEKGGDDGEPEGGQRLQLHFTPRGSDADLAGGDALFVTLPWQPGGM